MRSSQRFAPQAPLAIDPKAFGLMFEVDAPAPVDQRAGVAVVDVRGPLMHHAGYWFDSYEAIRSRVAEAFAAGPKAVVLRLDSPGGLVSGMLETARALRQMAEAAEIPLYAYVDGAALSAAYALACGCDRIYTSETGLLGSIGTLETLTDATAQAERWGLKHRLVASGARKTDGHPAVPISDDAVTHTQERVDSLAELFFEHVAASRPALSVDDVRGLEAGIAHGSQAVSIGLADEVSSFDNLLASIASGANPTPAPAGEDQMTDEEQARKALKAILEDDDADEKAKGKARKALAAMDEEEKDEGEESKSKAEAEEDKDDEAKASAASPATKATAPASSDASSEVAEMAAFVRAQMLDARPDLSPKMRALLESEPLAKVKAYLEAHPKPKANTAAAVANAAPTRGAGQGDGAPATEADRALAAQMDAAMGLTAMKPGVKREGTKLYLGVPVPETSTAG